MARPGGGLEFSVAGQPAHLQGGRFSRGLLPDAAALQALAGTYRGGARRGEQQVFFHQHRIAAADIRMGAGQFDFLVLRSHAVQGEVPAPFVAGGELHHLARAAGRQVEVDAGVQVVGRTPVAAPRIDDGRHCIEQANEVDARIAGPIETTCQAELPGPQHLAEQAAAGLEHLVGEMSSRRRAPAKAEDIEFEVVYQAARIGFTETIELYRNQFRTLRHSLQHTGFASPRPWLIRESDSPLVVPIPSI